MYNKCFLNEESLVEIGDYSQITLSINQTLRSYSILRPSRKAEYLEKAILLDAYSILGPKDYNLRF